MRSKLQFTIHLRQKVLHRKSGFTLIELLVASLIVSVVMLIAWSGLISLMNMSAMAEARTLRQVEINQALDFMTDELRTARSINATENQQVNGSTISIGDMLVTEGFNLDDLGNYGDLSLYLEIPATTTVPNNECPAGGPNAGVAPPSPSSFDRVIYDVRPSPSEWLGPRTLMRYGRIKSADGSFNPCEAPIASDPIADALSNDETQSPSCSAVLTGGPGFYACQEDGQTNLIFQHTLVNTAVAEIASSATSRLQSIQPQNFANAGCQNESTLRSLHSDIKAEFKILNDSENPIKLYGLDDTGDRQLAGTLNAAEEMTIQTFETHPWVVTNLSGQCLEIYVPDEADGLVIFEANHAHSIDSAGSEHPRPEPYYDN